MNKCAIILLAGTLLSGAAYAMRPTEGLPPETPGAPAKLSERLGGVVPPVDPPAGLPEGELPGDLLSAIQPGDATTRALIEHVRRLETRNTALGSKVARLQGELADRTGTMWRLIGRMNRMEPLGNTIQKQMEGLQQDLKAMSTGNSRIVDEIQGEMETLRQALIDLEATDGQESARERAAETQRTADGMLIDRMKDEVDQLWRKLNESTTLLEHDQRCLGRTVEQLAGSRAVWEYNSSAT